MIRFSAAAALALAIAACSPGPNTPAASTPAAGGAKTAGMGAATMADFRTKLEVKELMGHVIDYNSFGVWHKQGWIIDAEGQHELFPTDEAGWLAAESAAISLAESSNLLLLPGRPQDDDRKWVDWAHQLYDAAMKAQAAAQKSGELLKAGKTGDDYTKAKQEFFDAGGEMYNACVECHAHYVQGDEPGPVTKLPELPGRTPPKPTQ